MPAPRRLPCLLVAGGRLDGCTSFAGATWAVLLVGVGVGGGGAATVTGTVCAGVEGRGEGEWEGNSRMSWSALSTSILSSHVSRRVPSVPLPSSPSAGGCVAIAAMSSSRSSAWSSMDAILSWCMSARARLASLMSPASSILFDTCVQLLTRGKPAGGLLMRGSGTMRSVKAGRCSSTGLPGVSSHPGRTGRTMLGRSRHARGSGVVSRGD
mmetsp:Transcript_2958/g.7501  ORF Transcript_2958/g.7501 Transcript_2958/m.7501 type:complete len:211 (-) Transcript_2958:77-709(-)